MEGTLRCTLGSQAHHAHSFKDHTWSIQQSISTHAKHFHNIPQQNKNHTRISNCKHATHMTNTSTNRATHKKDIALHSPQLRSKRQ